MCAVLDMGLLWRTGLPTCIATFNYMKCSGWMLRFFCICDFVYVGSVECIFITNISVGVKSD
jgi:hypothetical protein